MGQIHATGEPNYGPISLLVVQATPYCNLDCDYCYLPDRDNRARLQLDLLDPILDRVLSSPFIGGDFTLLWHAGEPLAMPVSFYDEASRRIQAALERHPHRDIAIHQSIQTNGTLIDQRWCECFQRHQISVGVSLDGPAFIHDAHRRTRTGLGSHAAAMRGIGWLRRYGLPFHVISVLGELGLDHADTIFQFFLEQGIHDVGFNMEETEGIHRASSLQGLACERRFSAFMQRFWELTRATGGQFVLREFESVYSLAYADARLKQTDMNKPFVIVSVDHQGNFSTFDPELLAVHTEEYGDFVLGNVQTDSLEAVIATEKFQRIQHDMAAGVASCRQSCDYFGLCGGGAGSNKYWENGSFNSTETQACRYRVKLVADVVLAGLEEALDLRP